jgi:hypothetical protein
MKRWFWIVALAACGDGADRKAPAIMPPTMPAVVAVAAPEPPALPPPGPTQIAPSISPSLGEKIVIEDEDRDSGDDIVDVVDKCPDVPTNDDADDGCPEPAPPPPVVVIDSDSNDVPDVLDKCPDEAPDPDDVDGCPDPA